MGFFIWIFFFAFDDFLKKENRVCGLRIYEPAKKNKMGAFIAGRVVTRITRVIYDRGEDDSVWPLETL